MNLLIVLGLKDPQGFLFKELATWSENFNLDSKANIRRQCQQKLEEMSLQVWWAKDWVTYLPVAFFRGLPEDQGCP